MTFEEMCLDTRIMRAIAEMGFEQPSPIQAQSIPIAVEGKDMIGQARTGTGKTASFGIPMLQRINPKDKNLQAIVLCPTRELAIQSANEIRKLAKFLQGYGFRVQKSAFEALISHSLYTKLLREIEKFVTKEDSIRIYKIIGQGQVTVLGKQENVQQGDCIVI